MAGFFECKAANAHRPSLRAMLLLLLPSSWSVEDEIVSSPVSVSVLFCGRPGLWGSKFFATFVSFAGASKAALLSKTQNTSMNDSKLLYFVLSPPWHLSFCYWQIFWHSIWHIFGHFIWHIFWHSIWHSIWHIFWHLFWHIFWHSIWHSIWHIFWHIFWHSIWHSIWQIFWHMFWQTFWHFIWHTFWHSIWLCIWHTFWHSIWHIFWHFIWHIFWHSFWHSIWRSIWHIFWHSIWPLRSSGAHWARRVPGWGPAVLTELRGPRLRSSGVHWARRVPGWGPAVLTTLGRSQVEVQRCPLRVEVGEELGEELARRKWTWKWRQRWWRRRTRRKRRRRRTTLIKSNNPHLAGGEKTVWVSHATNEKKQLAFVSRLALLCCLQQLVWHTSRSSRLCHTCGQWGGPVWSLKRSFVPSCLGKKRMANLSSAALAEWSLSWTEGNGMTDQHLQSLAWLAQR